MDIKHFRDTIDISYKGVPGFSHRLNQLFDKANAPKATRLSWGAEKWDVAPNTIGNWLKKDAPPQRFATLQIVVSDLLRAIPDTYDANKVIEWLYTGRVDPFESSSLIGLESIDHILQGKIFNRLYRSCLDQDLDLERVNARIVNKHLSIIYWYLHLNRRVGKSDDIDDANHLFDSAINFFKNCPLPN